MPEKLATTRSDDKGSDNKGADPDVCSVSPELPINVQKHMQSDFPTLRLPKRFEALEREAKNTGAAISQLVQRIDSATARIETLVRQVRDGGLRRFELFLGKSGSGKITFFKTLGHFFEGINIHPIDKDLALNQLCDYIRGRQLLNPSRVSVYVLYDRDNFRITLDEAKEFFESLRMLFREEEGRVVIA
ncbi:hypothetical protein [uncultured Thiodictyon sp.]|uniref:hypothetical protein n=1 Tax=uncultured Thiodictyon sp. TaxID=1846217 RepID=UPI0025DBA7C5|nr:hypothetical protein [uncultured Thiodictyon sp.]